MAAKNLFYENMLLEVYDHRKQVYGKSIIQEVNDDNLAIGIPMKKNEQVALQEGVTYSFRAVLDDGLYYFVGEVLGTKSSGMLCFILFPARNKCKDVREEIISVFPVCLMPVTRNFSDGSHRSGRMAASRNGAGY